VGGVNEIVANMAPMSRMAVMAGGIAVHTAGLYQAGAGSDMAEVAAARTVVEVEWPGMDATAVHVIAGTVVDRAAVDEREARKTAAVAVEAAAVGRDMMAAQIAERAGY
jgi:hypothetical protein